MTSNINIRLEWMARKTKWFLTQKLIKSIKFRYSNYKKNVDLKPIFILGTSRSGTSMIASVIAQHSDVEGIFSSEDNDKLSFNKGHIQAYCGSHHIWGFHFGNNIHTRDYNEGILWGHPKHISKHYRDKINNKIEPKILSNSIQYYRKTNKIPLINSHFNMLRIGLIKSVFPNAKFVLIKDHLWSNCSKCLNLYRLQTTKS